MDRVWREEDTTPARIDDALRAMLADLHRDDTDVVPARVLNLVCVVDAEYSGEIANRLRGVGRFHASRTIVCSIEEGREQIDAVATLSAPDLADSAGIQLMRELIVVSCGTKHLPRLDRLVEPLAIADLPVCVWSPHGHDDGLASLMATADVVLFDSADETEVRDGIRKAMRLSQQAYLVDLAWLRTTPWRERIAATFDPPPLRGQLEQFSRLEVRVHPESTGAALLLIGWLASRLRWQTAPMRRDGDRLSGIAKSADRDIELAVVPDSAMPVRGLSGLTLETAAGRCLSLGRGEGGMAAHYTSPEGADRRWTILGASRGEPGILGEGLRQAMLRDRTFFPALDAASTLLAV
ncbi:MAG: glucose-6-phosphate dehydrogenase assembly protein OpcA [Baekduia sp.]